MNPRLLSAAALCLLLAASLPGEIAAAAEQSSAEPQQAETANVSVPAGNDALAAMASTAEKPPAIGDWTEFAALRDDKADLTDTLRISILADEELRDAPWLEVWMGKTGKNAIRIRKNGDAPTEIFMKMGSAIFSITDEKETKGQNMCATGTCARMNQNKALKGRQRIKTLAGTYNCNHYVIKSDKGTVELWSSGEVPGFNLVRMKASWGLGLELVAFGGNAYSAFPKRFKANPLPLNNLDTILRLMPGLAPPGSPAPPADPTGCDPSVATCPDQPPAPEKPLQPFDPKDKPGK